MKDEEWCGGAFDVDEEEDAGRRRPIRGDVMLLLPFVCRLKVNSRKRRS